MVAFYIIAVALMAALFIDLLQSINGRATHTEENPIVNALVAKLGNPFGVVIYFVTYITLVTGGLAFTLLHKFNPVYTGALFAGLLAAEIYSIISNFKLGVKP